MIKEKGTREGDPKEKEKIMRSMNYIAGGAPRNMDDCVDMVRHRNIIPVKIEINLKTVEFPHDVLFEVRQLVADFTWTFEFGLVGYEKVCGACICSESSERQRRSVDNANERLRSFLAKIAELAIEVWGKDKRFDYSSVYSKKEEWPEFAKIE